MYCPGHRVPTQQIVHINQGYLYDLHMNHRDEIERAARSFGGTVTTGEFERAGIPRNVVYRARDDGLVIELSRGVFRPASAPPIAELDFVAVTKRAPHGTVCLNSALSYWDLSDEIPASVHLAIPRDTTRPRIAMPSTTIHVFSPATFELERRRVVLATGESFWIYGPERSVIDALRLRRRHGGGPGLDALRTYLKRGRPDRRKLVELSRQLNVERAVLTALEVLG
jgi:hypothetical protein